MAAVVAVRNIMLWNGTWAVMGRESVSGTLTPDTSPSAKTWEWLSTRSISSVAVAPCRAPHRREESVEWGWVAGHV